MYNKDVIIRGKNNGYLYFIDKEHPLAMGNQHMVYLHRHVASISAGRWLTSEEVVHHIDENKENNIQSNLQVLTKEEHQDIHHPKRTNIVCIGCRVQFIPQHQTVKYCQPSCASASSIKNKTLSKELLEELIPKHTWVALGKMFGYQDNGIKKRAQALGCTIPSRKKSSLV